MFKQDITGTQKAASLTDTNPALPKSGTLRLRSENGATDRANSLLGNLTINHSPTKELGGGFRHVVRMNLKSQGSIPGASAYFVLINQDSLAGEARATECFNALLVALAQLAGLILNDAAVATTGLVSSFMTEEEVEADWDDVINVHLPTTVLPRLLGRES